jgi:hypothetical protein
LPRADPTAHWQPELALLDVDSRSALFGQLSVPTLPLVPALPIMAASGMVLAVPGMPSTARPPAPACIPPGLPADALRPAISNPPPPAIASTPAVPAAPPIAPLRPVLGALLPASPAPVPPLRLPLLSQTP